MKFVRQHRKLRGRALAATVSIILSLSTAFANEIISESELDAVYAYLGLRPEDHDVLEIVARAESSGLNRRYIRAFLKRRPYWHNQQLCVLETSSYWAEVSDGELHWADEEPLRSQYVWLSTSSGSCEVASAATIPEHVVVNGGVDPDRTIEILRLEDALFGRVIEDENGKSFSSWTNYTMSIIRPDRSNKAQSSYCAQFSHPGEMRGPHVCFRLSNGAIEDVRVGFWIS